MVICQIRNPLFPMNSEHLTQRSVVYTPHDWESFMEGKFWLIRIHSLMRQTLFVHLYRNELRSMRRSTSFINKYLGLRIFPTEFEGMLHFWTHRFKHGMCLDRSEWNQPHQQTNFSFQTQTLRPAFINYYLPCTYWILYPVSSNFGCEPT